MSCSSLLCFFFLAGDSMLNSTSKRRKCRQKNRLFYCTFTTDRIMNTCFLRLSSSRKIPKISIWFCQGSVNYPSHKTNYKRYTKFSLLIQKHQTLYYLFLDVKKHFIHFIQRNLFTKTGKYQNTLDFQKLNFLAEFAEINFLKISSKTNCAIADGVKQGGSLPPPPPYLHPSS